MGVPFSRGCQIFCDTGPKAQWLASSGRAFRLDGGLEEMQVPRKKPREARPLVGPGRISPMQENVGFMQAF